MRATIMQLRRLGLFFLWSTTSLANPTYTEHFQIPLSPISLSYERLNSELTRIWVRKREDSAPLVLFEGPVSKASVAGEGAPIANFEGPDRNHAYIQLERGPVIQVSADGSARALPPPIMRDANERLNLKLEIFGPEGQLQFQVFEWSSRKAHTSNANHRMFLIDASTQRFKFLQHSEWNQIQSLTESVNRNGRMVRKFVDPATSTRIKRSLDALLPEASLIRVVVNGPQVEIENQVFWTSDSFSRNLSNSSRSLLLGPHVVEASPNAKAKAKDPKRKMKTKDGQGEIDVMEYLDQHFSRWELKDTKGIEVDPAKLDEIALSFLKAETGSAVVTGEAGTGKSTLMRAFVQAVQQGRYPEIPAQAKFYYVDAASLGAGTSLVGVFEERVEVMKRAAELEPIIWVIDELHSLKGQGTSKYQSADFFQMIKPAMAEGRFRILGSSTEDEFQNAFAGDRAMMRRLSQVKLKAPEGEALQKALVSWVQRNSLPPLSEAQIQRVIQLSETFHAEGSQPAKSVQFLDSLYALLKLKGRAGQTPSDEDLLATAQKIYSADLAFISGAGWKDKLARVEKALNEQLIGNPNQKAELIRIMRNRLAGVQDPKRPAMTMLVGGRKGLGKTESLKILADALQVPYVHIEMGKYTDSYRGPELIRREIASALRKNPFSVINFDELEKASFEVQNALLSLFNEGEFVVTEQLGTDSAVSFVKVSARNAHFGATTNAGIGYLDSLTDPGFGFQKTKKVAFELSKFREALTQNGLSPYLVDRFDAVTYVVPPSRDEFRQVLSLHLQKLLKQLSEQSRIQVEIESIDQYLDRIVEERYSETVSNREAIRAIKEEITNEVAESLLKANHSFGVPTRIQLNLKSSCPGALQAFLAKPAS
jgi:ATP-dependent Clp protease ATP-binding subunit ClpA